MLPQTGGNIAFEHIQTGLAAPNPAGGTRGAPFAPLRAAGGALCAP